MPALPHYLYACRYACFNQKCVTQFSRSRIAALKVVNIRAERSPAEQFAPLASRFGRRLLVGLGSASVVALGANFLGITSFLLGLSPESSRNLKLDVLYPIGGYSRCIDTNEGFGQ